MAPSTGHDCHGGAVRSGSRQRWQQRQSPAAAAAQRRWQSCLGTQARKWGRIWLSLENSGSGVQRFEEVRENSRAFAATSF